MALNTQNGGIKIPESDKNTRYKIRAPRIAKYATNDTHENEEITQQFRKLRA